MTRSQRSAFFEVVVLFTSILIGLAVFMVYFRDNDKAFGLGLVAMTMFVVCAVLWLLFVWYQHKFLPKNIVAAELEKCGFEDVDRRNQNRAWSIGLDCPYGCRRVLLSFNPAPAKDMAKGDWLGVSSPVIFGPEQVSMELMCYAASLSMQYGYGTLSSLLVVTDPTGGPSVLAAIAWCEVNGLTANELRHRIVATAYLADIAISVFSGKVKEGDACA